MARIFSIYHGVDHELFRPACAPLEGSKYLLHVSAHQPKKNLNRILAAYQASMLSGSVKLIAVVPGFDGTDVPDGVVLIKEKRTHSELVTLYQNAVAFVFPSLSESFGMPIVEAMACGTPVITSTIPACKEIAGGAAILVNPRSVGDLAHALRNVSEDRPLRADLRKKGLQRAAFFSWERCAYEHLRVFHDVVGFTS